MEMVTKLIPPANFDIYPGADISSVPSGDGVIFWAVTGLYRGVDNSFGCYVFKQQGEQPAEQLMLVSPVPLPGRGSLQLGLDGLYYAAHGSNGREGYLFKIPGYVGNVQVATAPSMTDQGARDMARAALQAANEARGFAAQAKELANQALSMADNVTEALIKMRELIETELASVREFAADTAWGKIQDQWYLWATYKDQRLQNLIYNRVLKHIHDLGIKDTSQKQRASPVE